MYEVVVLLTKKYEAKKNSRINEKWSEYELISLLKTSCSQRVYLGRSLLHPQGRLSMKDGQRTYDLKDKYGCEYCAQDFYNLPTNVSTQDISNLVRFKTDIESPYKDLDYAMSANHLQIDWLENQENVPQNMKFSECRNFVLLRADGAHLQLRNLCAMLEHDGLSFNEKSVQALIMQTLYEKHEEFDVHKDFTNLEFVKQMCTSIDAFIERLPMHPTKLQTAALILARMFELNENKGISNEIVKSLRKLRDIIMKCICNTQNTTANEKADINMGAQRMLLADLCMAGVFTFNVNFLHKNFDEIFTDTRIRNASVAKFWCKCILTLNNCMLLDETLEKQENFQKSLKIVRRIGVGVQGKIRDLLAKDSDTILDVVKERWTVSVEGCKLSPRGGEVMQILIVHVHINNVQHNIQIDIVLGEFLVNNLKAGRLPVEITKHELFKRVFGSHSFEVQQEDDCSYYTIKRFHGHNYRFQMLDNNQLIVSLIERNALTIPANTYELIAHDLLKGDIPFQLVENYSHWWNRRTNRIEFRPKEFSNENFALSSAIDYQINLNYASLRHKPSGRNMLCVTSNSYKQITNQLSRLDVKKFIHIFVNRSAPKMAIVELTRMNLQFTVKASERMINEFDIFFNDHKTGQIMKVSLQQKIGTLIGLCHGLVLQEVRNPSSKAMLIPHGRVVAEIDKQHASVKVDINSELRKPAYHYYYVKDLLKQLWSSDSSYSSWFYLAYLHALTSHGEPETFTGLSGKYIFLSFFNENKIKNFFFPVQVLNELSKSCNHRLAGHLLHMMKKR